MRWLAIAGIWLYRLVVRPFLRRVCLFEESCSQHALRTLREQGYRKAVPLIQARVQSCRLPAAACYVVDESGRARLLFAESACAGQPVPPLALAHLQQQAAATLRGRG